MKRIILSEVIGRINENDSMLPSVNYFSFYWVEYIVPELLFMLGNADEAYSGGPGNHYDGCLSVLVGLTQLLDTKNHRPLKTKAQGAMNIASGVQLICVTALCGSFATGLGFTAAFSAAFAFSLAETYHAYRLKTDFTYWLSDSYRQIIQFEKNKDKLEVEIVKIKAELDRENLSFITRNMLLWALKRKQERILKNFLLQKAMLCGIVEYFQNNLGGAAVKKEAKRFILGVLCSSSAFNVSQAVDKHSFLNTLALVTSEDSLFDSKGVITQFIRHAQQEYHTKNYHSDLVSVEIETSLRAIKGADDSRAYFKETELSRTKANQTFVVANISNSAILGLAVVGMILLAIPFMQIPGGICVSVAAGLGLAKLSVALFSYYCKKEEKAPAECLETNVNSQCAMYFDMPAGKVDSLLWGTSRSSSHETPYRTSFSSYRDEED